MDDILKRLDKILTDKSVSPAPLLVKKLPDTAPKKAPVNVSQASSPVKASKKKRLFVIVTQDMSGLGWAKKLIEEGEDVVLATNNTEEEPEDKKVYEQVGKDWIPRTTFKKAEKELVGSGAYWIFDSNKMSEEADKLRTKGEKVFGTSELSAKMEHDRKFGVDVAKKSGLNSPETFEFSTVDKGLAFLDANPDKAYVFKPDDADQNRLTFVPFREKAKDANRELYFYLKHVEFNGTFILQERKYGVEVDVELWLYEGKPILGVVTLESKRKWNRDMGEMAGCAGDIVFVVDVESKIVKETIGKMVPFYAKEKYTGFIDVNVIIGDSDVWFLEVCDRFGYSSHPNLFLNLALDGFGSIMSDWIDGKVKGLSDKFRKGYGASISLFIEHVREGIPIYLNSDYCKRYYPFDGYRDGDDLLLAGYSNEVGIFMDYDYTPQSAAENCLHKLFYNEAVSFPDMSYRTDLAKWDYVNAPIRRHEALRRMGLIT